jgi:hypothetical protein
LTAVSALTGKNEDDLTEETDLTDYGGNTIRGTGSNRAKNHYKPKSLAGKVV